MTVERRDQKPEPTQEPQETKSSVTRRDFLVGAGSLVVGGVIGGVIGNQVVPKAPAVEEAPPAAEEPVAEGEESPYKAGYNIVFDPVQCTGCMKCAFACAEKYSTFLHPEETKNLVNLEYARIRPMRFQYVDVVNVCSYCSLEEWAEGSSNFPCAEVCPEEAIITIPEGEGEEGYYGMGYKWIDRDKCLGIDKCWRCAEICEDQFASGISFDPTDRKAQVCSRCGGDPECVKVCPEPLALQWVPASRNGRYFANQPTAYAELLYRKMYQTRREL